MMYVEGVTMRGGIIPVARIKSYLIYFCNNVAFMVFSYPS